MYEYDGEPCYEPTLADVIMMEYQQKMKDALLESVKLEIESIGNENSALRKEIAELRTKNLEVMRKESELKYKEENLKREVINEFYQSNIGDILKQYTEEYEVWFTGIERYQNEKCNICNEERKLVANFPNGEIAKTTCTCAKTLSKRVPASSTIEVIRFSKRDSRYSSDRHFYFSRSYSPPDNRDEYDYREFKIYHVASEFNEGIIELHENRKYGERLGFRNKEECQKYCDWLNSREVS